MKKYKSTILKYLVAVAIGASITLLFLYLNDFFVASQLEVKYKLLADAFTIPGLLYIMLSVLLFVSSQGTFDILTFGIGKFTKSLIPMSHKNVESFYDYKTRKDEGRIKGYSFILFTGIAFTVTAIVFTILFY